MSKNILLYLNSSEPYSGDPVEFDSVSHHVVFYSVYGTLVSNHGTRGVEPMLADNWEHSDDYLEWKFHIRKDLLFENGDPIDPFSIALSFKRLFVILKKRESDLSLMNNIIGIEYLKTPLDKIEGVSHDSNYFILKFKTPEKNLLATLSFGLFGIISKSNFDQFSGEFIGGKSIISSGVYSLNSWEKDSLTLKLRDQFLVKWGHPKKFEHVKISWSRDDENIADIKLGASVDNHLENMIFYGPIASNIAYVNCISAVDKMGPLHDVHLRKILRDSFYRFYESKGQRVTRSFFPLSINGVKEFSSDFVRDDLPSKITMPSTGIRRFLTSDINSALKEFFTEKNVKFNETDITFSQMRDNKIKSENHDFDISAFGTGISLEYPKDDIKFMFLSKEGVRLPDLDGKIKALLSENDFNIQDINQELWNQAVIWPLFHFSLGLWAKNEIDFSYYNQINDPIHFAWIGAN